MTRFASLVLFLTLCACGGGSPKSAAGPGVGSPTPEETPDPIPKTKGPECAIVADKLAIVLEAENELNQASTARDTIRTRCTEDKWSDEARNCFATVETDAEVAGCEKLLTDAQRRQLQPAGSDGAAAPSPTTTSPTRGGTRGPARPSDPCEGGEAKSADPCEGGE